MLTRFTPFVAIALAAGPAAVSAIELGRLDIAAPGAMISTCGGMGGMGAIGDKGAWLPGEFNCNAQQTASPNTSVAQSAAYAVGGSTPVDTSAHGETAMGQTRLYAQFVGSNAAGFEVAEGTGGWVDMLTLNPVNPADVGKTASFSFAIEVGGTLQGLPMGNSVAAFGVKPYVDDASILDGQGVEQQFSVQGQGQFGFPYDETVDHIATFTANVTLGTAFELGVFARALVGNASYSPGSSFVSAATVDFSHTISWAGVTAVTLDGNPLDYTLASASGIDWTQAYAAQVPEPSTWALWAVGLLGLGATVHRRRAPSAAGNARA